MINGTIWVGPPVDPEPILDGRSPRCPGRRTLEDSPGQLPWPTHERPPSSCRWSAFGQPHREPSRTPTRTHEPATAEAGAPGIGVYDSLGGIARVDSESHREQHDVSVQCKR
jgi:hypothetical protein